MEKLSRVKKYAELRKSIETDNNIDKTLHTEENAALEQEETLKKFDSSIFKKVDIKEDEEYTPVREKKEQEPLEQPPVDDTFTNEYLDDFIKEVREYNIRKGTRESDNTQADILYQLNAANRVKRSHYIQEIQEEPQPEETKKTILSRDDIALQVQNLLKEEEAPSFDSDMRLQRSQRKHLLIMLRRRMLYMRNRWWRKPLLWNPFSHSQLLRKLSRNISHSRSKSPSVLLKKSFSQS